MSAKGEPAAKKARLGALSPCPYGKKCYRKNPQHFKEYSHPKDDLTESDSSGDDSPATAVIQVNTSKLPPCPFGAKCYRKNLLHFAEYSHPFTNDGASTSKDIPDDAESGSDTDVYDSEEEERKQEEKKNSKMKELMKRGPSLAKRYSLMSEQERKELIEKALAMKKKLQEELEETKKTVEEKENAIKKMQDEMNKGVLLVDGEKEALEGDEIKYFTLMPERHYKEGSAAQIHFRLAESQFYRLLSGPYSSTYQVTKVEYAVNPKLVKKFNEAREELKKTRGDEFAHPILAFHGTEEKNITPIVETGFRIPGTDDPKLKHRMKNEGLFGKGIYFSEFTHYSLGYVAGANKILLSKVLPGMVFHTTGMITGHPLKAGFDSHMSPCKKELVMFDSARILPCYVVHYNTTGQEFKYKKPDNERRKAKSKDELMRLYWKAQKKPASGIFAGLNVAFCGDFADDVSELEKLIKKHGGNCTYTDAAKPSAATGRGRGRGRRGAPFGAAAGGLFGVHFHWLFTTEKVFAQKPQHPVISQAASNRASVVREEYLYDCVIKKQRLDIADYELD